MKSEKLLNAIGQIDDALILDTEVQKAKKPFFKTKGFLIPMAAACLVLAITAAFVFSPKDSPTINATGYALGVAKYPERVMHPADFDDFSEFDKYIKAEDERVNSFSKNEALNGFIKKSSVQFLKNSGEENIAYSPVNVYFALSMLSEVCDGESREQVLSLLGSENIAEQRENVYSLWNSHYRNDGAITSLFANSLWTRNDMKYNQKTIETLANEHFASSFSGEMGTDGYNAALQNWINEQTGGLFENNLNDVKMKEDTVLALASTANFAARWDNEFRKEKNDTKIFHGKDGDSEAEFLNQRGAGAISLGTNFMAYKQEFSGGGGMWFILPDEGVEASDLAEQSEVYDFLVNDGRGYENVEAMINLSVPKFDVSAQFDLKGGLKELGIKDVFDYKNSDFSPLTDECDGLFVSSALHGTRVKIDEEGCVAAAYTVIAVESMGALITDKEINFTLDRPFIFGITSDLGVPLFIGVINTVK